MAVTVTERQDSRSSTTGANASVERTYLIRGTASDLTAKSKLADEAPETYDALVLDNLRIEPLFIDESNNAASTWLGTARYVQPEKVQPEVGESRFSFDTGGGTQHITQSLSTIGSYVASGTAPDFKGAIGVTHDSVQGVDITVPVYKFSETHVLADSMVTEAYRGTLHSLTGTTNDATFKGLAIGECLFLGAAGSKRADGDWEITYNFAASPNRTNITVGDITVTAKKGWEYLWVSYEDAEDTTAKQIVKKPSAAYIEKVYEAGDFSDLGIGTT